jgi:hypothetical protein
MMMQKRVEDGAMGYHRYEGPFKLKHNFAKNYSDDFGVYIQGRSSSSSYRYA